MSEIKTLDMPKWGLSMEEGTLSHWLVKEGSTFTKGQEICEIETSKVVNSLEAPFTGTLRKYLVHEGDTVAVGAVLALAADASVSDEALDAFAANLGTEKSSAPTPPAAPTSATPVTVATESLPATTSPSSLTKSPQPASPSSQPRIPESLQGATDVERVKSTPHALRQANKLGVDLGKVNGSGREGRISVADLERAIIDAGGQLAPTTLPSRSLKRPRSHADDSQVSATPLARRLASQLGINLHDCRASGSQGRVSRDDVQAAALLLNDQPQAVPEVETLSAAFEDLPMSGMRRAIATRLQESKHNAPHFRLTINLDLDPLLKLRKEINAGVKQIKVSVNDLLVKACAQALVTVPDVNVQFDETSQSIRRFADADISVAVALPTGLITPIVRMANRKSISEISQEIHTLITHAKAGTLKPEQFLGGTFSISNLGMLGVNQFDAIINPPQGAILAVGAGEERAVVRGGQLVACQQLTVSLSCDHRMIDGAQGAVFLQELKRLVETPTLMLV